MRNKDSNQANLLIHSSALPTEQHRVAHFSAFGMIVEAPEYYLGEHSNMLDPAGAPDLRITVCLQTPQLRPDEWLLAVDCSDSFGESPTRGYLRRYDHADGLSRYFQIINSVAVEVRPQDASLIVYVPPTMDRNSVGAFILSSAMLCHFKALQYLCLHAAVLHREGRSIAVCGPSGAGKSSLAAALGQRGWTVMAEDLCVIEPRGAEFRVRPGYGRIRLWRDSVIGLGTFDSAQEIVSGSEKYYVDGALSNQLSPPLASVFFLGPRLGPGHAEPKISRFTSRARAAALLYKNSLAPYLNLPAESRVLFGRCANMANSMSCHELFIPDGYQHLDEVSMGLAATADSSG